MVSNFLIGNNINLNNSTYLRSITTGKVIYESDVIKLKQNTDYFDDCDTQVVFNYCKSHDGIYENKSKHIHILVWYSKKQTYLYPWKTECHRWGRHWGFQSFLSFWTLAQSPTSCKTLPCKASSLLFSLLQQILLEVYQHVKKLSNTMQKQTN